MLDFTNVLTKLETGLKAAGAEAQVVITDIKGGVAKVDGVVDDVDNQAAKILSFIKLPAAATAKQILDALRAFLDLVNSLINPGAGVPVGGLSTELQSLKAGAEKLIAVIEAAL